MTASFALMAVMTAASPPALPEAFSSFGAITLDGYAYVYGGHAAKTHSYSTETTLGKFRRLKLDAMEKGWEELTPGVACQGLAIVAHGSKIYRIGGMRPRNAPGEKPDQVSLATCEAFDVKAGTWSKLPDLPTPRSSFDAVVVGDAIYIVGGWNMKGAGKSSEWSKDALKLDLSQSPLKWESFSQPFVRRALTAATLNGKIYIVVGLNDEDDIERSVNIYDTTKGTWQEGPELPSPSRNGFAPATCVESGKLFASPADGNVYQLDESAKGWLAIATLKQPRIVHRMLGNGRGGLLVFGGAGKGTNISEVELIAPAKSASADH